MKILRPLIGAAGIFFPIGEPKNKGIGRITSKNIELVCIWGLFK